MRQRLDRLVEIDDRQFAGQLVAVDEKGRRRIDVERLGGALAALAHLLVEIGIAQAFLREIQLGLNGKGESKK